MSRFSEKYQKYIPNYFTTEISNLNSESKRITIVFLGFVQTITSVYELFKNKPRQRNCFRKVRKNINIKCNIRKFFNMNKGGFGGYLFLLLPFELLFV